MTNIDPLLKQIKREFSDRSIPVSNVSAREFPDEVIVIVTTPKSHLNSAAELGNKLDSLFAEHSVRGFISVKVADSERFNEEVTHGRGVKSREASAFVALLAERARTSLIQPSLSYISDTATNLSKVMTSRHHIVFGRRGAGKTSLLLESRRNLVDQGHIAIWINLQTFRSEGIHRALLWIIDEYVTVVEELFSRKSETPTALQAALSLRGKVKRLLDGASPAELTESVPLLIPTLRQAIKKLSQSTDRRVYIFLDDFHYMPRDEQPLLLDLLHGAVRDIDAWLKIATIRHMSRWFTPQGAVGLQLGHDADPVDLDLTLQNPSLAKEFLEEVLLRYAIEVGLRSLSAVMAPRALDRLLLASGAVPRDYLVLCSKAISFARSRDNAVSVGTQDVVRAAGEAAKSKISELEDDAAANAGESERVMSALTNVRKFCLDDKKCTFFRVDFKEREVFPFEYAVLQSLMDARLIHIVNASVSDEHRAGERFEAYMLDLSQFSGQRMKKGLRVLDFQGGLMVLAETGKTASRTNAKTAKGLIQILRRGPALPLGSLSEGL